MDTATVFGIDVAKAQLDEDTCFPLPSASMQHAPARDRSHTDSRRYPCPA